MASTTWPLSRSACAAASSDRARDDGRGAAPAIPARGGGAARGGRAHPWQRCASGFVPSGQTHPVAGIVAQRESFVEPVVRPPTGHAVRVQRPPLGTGFVVGRGEYDEGAIVQKEYRDVLRSERLSWRRCSARTFFIETRPPPCSGCERAYISVDAGSGPPLSPSSSQKQGRAGGSSTSEDATDAGQRAGRNVSAVGRNFGVGC